MCKVTQEMLEAAMKKAVELKIIPKWGDAESYVTLWDGMKQVLEAGLNCCGKEE